MTRSFEGVELTIEIADPLAGAWYDRDIPLISEIAAIRDAGVGLGARVFYLGAHQCVHALVVCNLVGPTGTVIGVEPDRHNVQLAECNRANNHAQNLTVLQAAASASPGIVTFSGQLTGRVNGDGRLPRTTVRSVTLDELSAIYGEPDAVIIDVEGFEQAVLVGGQQTLDRRRTTFWVEVHTGCGLELAGGTAGKVLANFLDRGYRVTIPPTPAPYLGDDFYVLAVPDSQ